MAPNDRAERRLMRQRGAGARDLGNVNFGFTFGALAPLAPRNSSRRTPQPLPSRLSSRRSRTPNTERQRSTKKPKATEEPGTARSTRSRGRRSTSVTAPTSNRQTRASSKASPKVIETPSGFKRKRTGPNQQDGLESDQDELEIDDASHRASTKKRKTIASGPAPPPRRLTGTPRNQEDDADDLGQESEKHMLSGGKSQSGSRTSLATAPSETTTPTVAPRGVVGARPSITNDAALDAMANSLAGTIAQQVGALFRAPQPLPSRQKVTARTPGKLLQPGRDTAQQAAEDSADELSPSHHRSQPGEATRLKSTPMTKDLGVLDELSPARPERSTRKDGHARPSKRTTHETVRDDAQDELSPGQHEQPTKTLPRHKVIGTRTRTNDPEENEMDELSPAQHDRHGRTSARNKHIERKVPRIPREQVEEAESSSGRPGDRQSKPKTAVPEPESAGSDDEISEATPLPTPRRRKPSGNSSSRVQARRPAHLAKSKIRDRAGATRSTSPPTRRRKRNPESSIPITVYRLFRSRNRRGAQEDDTDLDPLQVSGGAAHTSIAGVNAVDVFAQITHEILDRQATRLREQALGQPQGSAKRGELKRKRIVVQSFGKRLADRLFELTEAADAGVALKKQLKAVLKEKVRLREELLSVRRQRDEVAFRMDEVRREHKEKVDTARARDEANEVFWDVEVAIQRGKDKAKDEGREDEGPAVGLEMLLDTVAQDVSSKDGGGLLAKVKHFNGFLEKAAGVFEGRV